MERALAASGVEAANARSVAAALTAAERDGHHGHGLSRIVSYAAQARAGKVDGTARPALERLRPGFLKADARFGFAYPAIDLAIEALPGMARETGVAAAAITRSHHFGVAGYHCERLAAQGMMALAFSNAPKAMAPYGGKSGLYGTNPIAFAIPRARGAPLVIDLALSVGARGLVMAARQKGEAIAPGWALDKDGAPTTDAAAAMAGTMVPAGGPKGAALALMLELIAGAFIGANFAYEASSLFDGKGGPPNIAHLLIAFDVSLLNGGDFVAARAEQMAAQIEAQGAHVPGMRRIAHRQKALSEGVRVPLALVEEAAAMIARAQFQAAAP
jgi:(2R)-3-sulfolactate dehydrogenase (NADP+)